MSHTDHIRCRWCNLKNPLYVAYHDSEWGKPRHDDAGLFEFLVLEPFQAGLSWETVLNKRENFSNAFDGFDPHRVCRYGEVKIAQLMENSGIVRNRKKIEAAICNAGVFWRIQQEWGTFGAYIWHFTDGKTIYETGLTKSPLSDSISRDLKKRGMKFIGTTTVYSYLQAIGIIQSHDQECFLYQEKPSG